jgi:hypothetical protein
LYKDEGACIWLLIGEGTQRMDSAKAARIFHDWAIQQGFMDEASGTVISTDAEFALIENVTEKGVQILRQKRVRAVGFNESRRCIVVFTKKAAPGTKRQLAALPDKVNGIDIEYHQGVPQTIGVDSPTTQGAPAYAVRSPPGTGKHYYTCGSSISVGNNRDAGTLTSLVQDTAGEIFGLSNNHICGGCSYADVGLPIVAPGIADVTAGGLNPFTIGFHHQALPLVTGSPGNVNAKANMDAAIFKLLSVAAMSSFQRDIYDTPLSTGPLVPGAAVEKVGRTTAHTQGTVISQVYGSIAINYQAALHNFAGPVFFDPLFTIAGTTGLFSDQGDSGSLITSLDGAGNRIAVGIVVGGMNDQKSPGGKVTLAIPIEPILTALSVTLVSGHNI